MTIPVNNMATLELEWRKAQNKPRIQLSEKL